MKVQPNWHGKVFAAVDALVTAVFFTCLGCYLKGVEFVVNAKAMSRPYPELAAIKDNLDEPDTTQVDDRRDLHLEGSIAGNHIVGVNEGGRCLEVIFFYTIFVG